MNFKNLVFLLLLFTFKNISAQNYLPITITGFNHDVVAESGTSSLTTTTSALDGVTISNKVIYSNAFKIANGFGGGGLADNGTITSGLATFQLAAYSGSNALIVPRSQNADLTISTPAKFTAIRLLAFSTEASALVNITVFFTDGTSVNAVTNYTLPDWFNGTPNQVIGGFGRCTRATPASGADAYPSNPSLYYIEIPISCANRQKNVQRINVANVTTAGNNAPFPNAVFFAASGISFTQTTTSSITNANCTTNGSATLTITGSTSPYNISWNSTPTQTGATANNLPAGSYVATITDAGGCITTFPATITLTNNLTLTAHADTTICPGASFNANTISNATSYSWTPTAGVSNTSIANPVLSPTVTTTYSLTGTLGSNCTLTKSFTVTVPAAITLIPHIDTTICVGSSFNSNTISNGQTFNWSPSTGVSNTAISNPVLNPTTTTPYTIIATTGVCSITKTFTVTVPAAILVNAGPDVTIAQGSSTVLQAVGSVGTYVWTPSTGLSATNILTPTASPNIKTTYRLTITSSIGCTGFDDVIVDVIAKCLNPMNAFTPNQDGINDLWIVSSYACATNIKANVYNRYGSLVYESTNYQNNWNGTYKNKPVPDGTYYYVVEYLSNGKTLTLKGDVTILR